MVSGRKTDLMSKTIASTRGHSGHTRLLRDTKQKKCAEPPSGYFTRVQVSVLQTNQTQPLILTVFASMTSSSAS